GSGGYAGGHSGAVWNQDIVGNFFVKGPSSTDSFLAQFTGTDHVYQRGNVVDLDRDGKLAGRDVVEADFRGQGGGNAPTFERQAYNHPSIAVNVMSTAEAYAQILRDVGDSLVRDSVDSRLIDQLRSLGKSGAIIKDETSVGGPGTLEPGTPPLDTDR